MRVQRGVVAARARRDPAAERRKFERLRKVAQGKAVRSQLVFQGGSVDAALDPCSPRRPVDVENAIQVAQVDGNHAGATGVAGRLDAAHNA